MPKSDPKDLCPPAKKATARCTTVECGRDQSGGRSGGSALEAHRSIFGDEAKDEGVTITRGQPRRPCPTTTLSWTAVASEGALAGKLSPCTVSCGRLGRFGDEAVAHLAQTLDLGLHDIADFEEAVGALADAATVPQLKMSPGSSVRMLEAYSICSSGVKMSCEVLPFCLTSPLTVRRMNRFIWSGTKARGTRNGPIGAKLSWLLPPSQSERSAGRSVRICRSRQDTSFVVMKPATWSSACSALMCLPGLPMASAISASQSIFFMPRGIAISSKAPAR